MKYLESISLWIEKQEYEKTDLLHVAQDRQKWRIMALNVCNRYDGSRLECPLENVLDEMSTTSCPPENVHQIKCPLSERC